MHLPKIYDDVASTPGTARDNQPSNKVKTMAKKTISVEVGTGRGAPIFTKSSCKLEKKLRLIQEMTTADQNLTQEENQMKYLKNQKGLAPLARK